MLPLVLLPPQHLGRGEARRAAADDHDLVRRRARRPAARRRLGVAARFSLTKTLPSRCSTDQQSIGLKRRRRERLARAQAEAGMMPGAAHGVADHQPFGQRTVIVAAMSRHREDFVALDAPAGPRRRRHGRPACRRRRGRRVQCPASGRGRWAWPGRQPSSSSRCRITSECGPAPWETSGAMSTSPAIVCLGEPLIEFNRPTRRRRPNLAAGLRRRFAES